MLYYEYISLPNLRQRIMWNNILFKMEKKTSLSYEKYDFVFSDFSLVDFFLNHLNLTSYSKVFLIILTLNYIKLASYFKILIYFFLGLST